MHGMQGLLLVAAGVGFTAYSYALPRPDFANHLAEVTRISAAPDRGRTALASAERPTPPRTFSAASPVSPLPTFSVAAQRKADPDATTGKHLTSSESEQQIAALGPPPPQARRSSWTAIVRTDGASTVATKPTAGPDTGDGAARRALTRNIQAGLKASGCYGGAITGTWSPATRDAMAAFMVATNASLPVTNPDSVLLALVENHAGTGCSTLPGKAPIAATVVATAAASANAAVVAPVTREKPRAVIISDATSDVTPEIVADSAKPENTRLAATVTPPVRAQRPAAAPQPAARIFAIVTEPDKPAVEPLPGRMSVGMSTANTPPASPTRDIHPLADHVAPIAEVAKPRPISQADRRRLAALVGEADEAAVLAPSGDDQDTSETHSAALDDGPTANSARPVTEPSRAKIVTSKSAARRARRAAKRSKYVGGNKPAQRPSARRYASRNNYQSKGSRKRGEPRPGTIRFFVAQGLGGIY